MNIEDLMNDSEFVAKLEGAKDLTEVAAIFREKGVEVTEEQLQELIKSAGTNGELDETLLEDVAGGAINWKKVGKVIVEVLKKSVIIPVPVYFPKR